MAEHRLRSEWARHSALMALIANCNSTKEKFQPSDFDPFAPKTKARKVDAKYGVGVLANWIGAKQL